MTVLDVAITVVVLLDVPAPAESTSATVKSVVTVCPTGRSCGVGVNTNASSAAMTAAALPVSDHAPVAAL
jgi:hypothetical protein